MGILNSERIKPGKSQRSEKRLYLETKTLGVKFLIGSKREDIQSRLFNKLLMRKNKNAFWALKDINLNGYSGEIIGIIGSNGAGKTTLCRVISDLLRPDYGSIKLSGNVSSLLSLGTGFNSELSGRENIILNGMMLGYSKKYLQNVSDEIIAFSGIGHFIDQPLKTYSSGMKSRLAFSIATIVEPEITVIDEALNAGDLKFSQKASKKLSEIVINSKMVIFVTHDLLFVRRFCTRVIWIDNGRIMADGEPEYIVQRYMASIPKSNKKKNGIIHFKPELSSSDIQIENLSKIIEVNDIALKYKLAKKKTIKNSDRKIKAKKEKYIWPLKNISFSVNEGDIVGIIGANGAGKTTLCRVLCGILRPDKGNIAIRGKVTAMLSVGTGFNIQLTGEDNIFLNGMMIGIPKKKLKNLYDDIVEFSGISKFIKEPIKNYSNGMKSRLGFSISAMIKPDIFIIDEALGVGDVSFNEMAKAKIQELISDAKAVIVVTHNLSFVENICNKAIWLDEGLVKYIGNPKEVVKAYSHNG